MIKKLDWYTIRTYFGPFLFIFSVLFFIFMVQFAWKEMDRFAGKGLDAFTIFKLLFYMGLSLIQLVLPLTILLSSIMTFGGFGERYELAAMKSSGISLWRVMLPLFILTCGISVGLYFFSDRVVPMSQRKAQNMLLNIVKTKPAINFTPGVFIDGVPGFSMKIGNSHGKDGQYLENVFIHRDASSYDNQLTITAEKGVFEPAEDKRFLKLALFDGYYYENIVRGLNRPSLQKQPYQQIKFDTLIHYFDISEIVEKAIEKENITDYYKFMNTVQLKNRVDTLDMENHDFYDRMADEQYKRTIYQYEKVDSLYQQKKAGITLPDLDEMVRKNEKYITSRILDEANQDLIRYNQLNGEAKERQKFYTRHILILVRSFSNSIMCIVFFLIGAPLGAVIRKGGVGMPVVVAIVIFILFYVVYMTSENLAKNGSMDPYWASWLPVILFLPLSLFFTYKANKDSNIFEVSSYTEPIVNKFHKIFKFKNREHARYQ